MLPADCSKLCNSDSTWVGVFAIRAISSAKSAIVIIFAGYHLFLNSCSVKTFSFIRSIDDPVT